MKKLNTMIGATLKVTPRSITIITATIGMATAFRAYAETTDLVDAVDISADTNIVVAANNVLKIEYVYGDVPVTVTKSGDGRLEIATSSISNLSVVVAGGTFASARPAAIPLNETFEPSLRLDASDASKFTFTKSNGTNFISKVVDADGKGAYFQPWWVSPYIAEEKLNGLDVIDFGTLLNSSTGVPNGYGGMFGIFNVLPGQNYVTMGEVFYIWKDRDDSIDHELINGSEFGGPCVLGNNPSYFTRGKGGAGSGFPLYDSGMSWAVRYHLNVDGAPIAFRDDEKYRVSRGFHLYRNRFKEGESQIGISTVGFSNPYRGGFLLAELVVYSNRLSEATARRVAAQLQSKWLGMKLNAVQVQEGATLDVNAFKFNIGSLDLQGEVSVAGLSNLCFDTLARDSGNVSASGAVAIDGARQQLMPDLSYAGDAEVSVVGQTRIQTVSAATTGRLVKSGDGELCLADPAMSNITVSAGTLRVSPLYVRSAEYHLDATRSDTIDWTETDGKKLVSAWHDIEDPSRKFVATTWRTPKYDSSHLVRPPYLATNAVGSLTMVDFGTYASADHQDGWGGCLDGAPAVSGLRDLFVAWVDDPAVKDYALGAGNAEFTGPCFFGMQYHWTRGSGGGGNSFAVHYSGCPLEMWSPPESGLIIVDGNIVHGLDYRLDDGVHVLAERANTVNGQLGVPVEQIGGIYLTGGPESKGVYGGLKMGEVLLFKTLLTDRLRMRISGALCSKWRGDTNEWHYGTLSVAADATLDHPFADVVPEVLELGGAVSAVSVKPETLRIAGNAASVVGTLVLNEGTQLVIDGDEGTGFACVSATAVKVAGRGTLAFSGDVSSNLVGQEIRIVASDDIEAGANLRWTAPSLAGKGMKARMKVKSDGLYVAFEPNGLIISVY